MRVVKLVFSGRKRASATSGQRYDAFISYSHAKDRAVSEAVQDGLQRLAKPWMRKALHVFRDDTSLSANPNLWEAIEDGLRGSRFFVLMASPEAAASPWVQKEVAFWQNRRSPTTFVIVVTDGTIAWDQETGDFDWARTTALPRRLSGWFDSEPLWITLNSARSDPQLSLQNPEFRAAVCKLASPIHGIPPDEIDGKDIQVHRKARTRVRWTITGLVFLTVLSLVGLMTAAQQRNRALDQVRIATARQLASTAVAGLDTRIGLSQLLAVEAHQLDRSSQSRSALFQANAAGPHLVRQHAVGATITALGSSRDGDTVVAGTDDGRLVRWNTKSDIVSEKNISNDAIVNISVNKNGRTVAATDGSTLDIWIIPTQKNINFTKTSKVVSLAIAPSGKTVAALSTPEENKKGTGRPILSSIDAGSGNILHRKRVDWSRSRWFSGDLGMPDNETVVLVGYDGKWRRFSVANLRGLSQSEYPSAPASGYRSGFSQDASHFGYTKHGRAIAYDTRSKIDSESTHTANLNVTEPEHLVISNNGKYMAAAGGGEFHLSGLENTALASLDGYGNIDEVTFLGNGPKLVSASDTVMTLWDPSQESRLQLGPSLKMPTTSNVGGAPRLALSPDGERLAVASGDGEKPAVFDMTSPEESRRRIHVDKSRLLPVWSADGSRLYLLGKGGSATAVRGNRVVERWEAAGDSSVITAKASADHDHMIIVTHRDGVQIRDINTGKVKRTIAESADIENVPNARHGIATIDEDARFVAMINEPAPIPSRGPDTDNSISLIDTNTGRTRRLDVADANAVSFRGNKLIVQKHNGIIEMWNPRKLTKLNSFTGDSEYTSSLTPIKGTNLIARLRADGTAVIMKLDTGKTLGSFSLPPRTRGTLSRPWSATVLASASNGILLTATSGGRLVRWNMKESAWMRIACTTAGRDLTEDEWQNIVGTEVDRDLSCRK